MGQSDITFNDQTGSRKIAGTKFLTQGSVIPQVLVDPSQPGTLYVVTVQDPSAGTANPAVLGGGHRHAHPELRRHLEHRTTSTIAPASSTSVFQLFPTASIDPSGDIVGELVHQRRAVPTNCSGDYLLDT